MKEREFEWLDPDEVPMNARLRSHFNYIRNVLEAVGLIDLISEDKGVTMNDQLSVCGYVVDALSELEDPYISAICGRFFYGLTPEKLADTYAVTKETVEEWIEYGLWRIRREFTTFMSRDGAGSEVRN